MKLGICIKACFLLEIISKTLQLKQLTDKNQNLENEFATKFDQKNLLNFMKQNGGLFKNQILWQIHSLNIDF